MASTTDLSGWTCYQCEKPTTYLFEDSRCSRCTRLTPEEVINGRDEEDDEEDDDEHED